jgi:parvulin-like peptidyl-prolyl isomerase
MKKIIIIALILAVGAAACSSKKAEGTKLGQTTPAYKLAKDLTAVLPIFDPDKNRVLLTTKSFDVTISDVAEVIYGTMGNASAQLAQMDPARLKTAVSQTAVQIAERRLLLAAAAAAKFQISPEDVTKALAEQYASAGGEDKFLEAIKTSGGDLEFIKKTIGEDQTIRGFLEKTVFAPIKVSDEDIKKAYAEDKTASVRHILLLTQGKPETEKPAIRKKMEDLLARAKKGDDFAALAKEFTEDQGSKETGGLYEDFPRGKMVQPFNDAAFSVPVGEISGIVETEYGYHILKIEGRKKETEPLETVKPQIETALKQQKQAGAYESFMAGIKGKAKIVEVKF